MSSSDIFNGTLSNIQKLLEAKSDEVLFLDQALAAEIAKNFGGSKSGSYPVIKRCQLITPYLRSSGELAQCSSVFLRVHFNMPHC
jgi:hypothetical protein